MRDETGCDAVLVARGACGNPWIFRDLRAAERGEPMPGSPTRDEWVGTVMRHVQLQIEHRARLHPGEDGAASESHAVRELRKHLLWYTRGLKGGVHFRRDATAVERRRRRGGAPGPPLPARRSLRVRPVPRRPRGHRRVSRP